MEQSMESARTITHLAAANQQLAAAHNIALGHVQCLLNELRKKPDRTRTSCPSCGRKDNCARSAGKLRVLASKQFNVLKPTNRKLRKLKKLPAFDESKDAEISAGSAGEEAEESERLKEAMEELRAFKSESQTRNDKLTRDLERQTLLIERLSRDFKESQSECERKERSLEEARERLSRAELESARILALFETFQCERREQAEERRKQFHAIDELTRQIRGLEAALRDGNQLRQRKVPSDPAPGAEEASSRLEGETEEGEAGQQDSGRNEQFKKELVLKREARQRAIAAISAEMERLRRELEAERLGHAETGRLLEELREELGERRSGSRRLEHLEAVRLLDLLKLSDELASNLLLQLERTDDLRFQLESEPEEHRQRIGLLRRLAEETRTSLECRKRETGLLKDRLAQILVRLGEERDLLDRPDDVRRETERQLEDIARSRILCDERSRILAELKEHSAKQIHELKLKLGSLSQDNQSLEEDLRKTEDKMDAQDSEILNLESQLGLAKADCRDLQNQMTLINSLFTQMLLSASSAEMDLDRLTQLLQENHDLICGMARESGTEAAALPKLLLDIVEQVDGRDRDAEEKKEEDELLQEKNIAHNLPKVWRVLLELLSCQVAGTNPAAVAAAVAGGSSSAGDEPGESTPDSCYKSVDTPSGPRLVISVSKTYIRLKELILEKKHLEKEMNRMKQLNSHLESKLSEQEKRLSTVSAELSKTWNIVGRMEAQHQQLHTHEKILRYELQQKRKMLQELKQELEYCREKWESARQKNTNTEIEWKSLRREFAARKALVTHASSFSNSGESGFSDDREESDEDERDVGKSRPRHVSSRRRSKKDDARPNSPDTESTTEQPTDAELSESKTASSSGTASRQHTPARESESQSEDCQDNLPDEASTAADANEAQNPEAEILDPLDKALVRVIENLLDTREASEAGGSSTSVAVEAGPSKSPESAINQESVKEEIKERKEEEEAASVDSVQTVASASSSEEPSVTPRTAGSVSIFSIGPIPAQALEARSPEAGRLPFVFDLSSGCPGEAAKPSTSSTTSQVEASSSSRQPAEEDVVLDARAARLKSLEEQARWLVRKVNDTNRRGSALSSRLEELHETYGSPPAAPPMPDVLPTFRLRTEERQARPDDAEPPADETT